MKHISIAAHHKNYCTLRVSSFSRLYVCLSLKEKILFDFVMNLYELNTALLD